MEDDGQPLSELALCPSVISQLREAGFTYDTEVRDLQPTELSAATELSLKECIAVIREATKENIIEPVTVLQMLEAESEVGYIVTFCKDLDDMLGGGIPLRATTEFYGIPGVGKTQLCLQACVSVQLPVSLGGLGGEAVFIDTEGSFSAGRLKDMATHAVDHVKSIGGSEDDVLQFTVESVLRHVHYFRCLGNLELVAVIRHIPDLQREYPRIQLIVIDSIAFHFRHDTPDKKGTAGLLQSIIQELIEHATTYNTAVILTNQLTTRVESDGSSNLVNALGDAWGHLPTIRIALHWERQVRVAALTKSPDRCNASVNYQVTVAGIRDVVVDKDPITCEDLEIHESKRRKLLSTEPTFNE